MWLVPICAEQVTHQFSCLHFLHVVVVVVRYSAPFIGINQARMKEGGKEAPPFSPSSPLQSTHPVPVPLDIAKEYGQS